jgi:ubiquitin C-terminal hydrolase
MDERLSAENALECASCGRRSLCMKKLVIKSLPECLVVHVKRFSETGMKCSDAIAFPLVGLDLSTYMSTNSSALYDCVAVCSHNGKSLNSGHYTAFSQRGGHWYLFDDGQRPRPVDEALIISEAEMMKVYLIFYVRRT